MWKVRNALVFCAHLLRITSDWTVCVLIAIELWTFAAFRTNFLFFFSFQFDSICKFGFIKRQNNEKKKTKTICFANWHTHTHAHTQWNCDLLNSKQTNWLYFSCFGKMVLNNVKEIIWFGLIKFKIVLEFSYTLTWYKIATCVQLYRHRIHCFSRNVMLL